MTEINKLSAIGTVSSGDQLAVWATGQGDTRKVSVSDVVGHIESALDLPVDISRSQYSAPSASGFTVTVTAANTWLIINPTNDFAAGTVSLPVGVPDLSMVSVVSTKAVSDMTVTAPGAAVVGSPRSMAQNTAFTMRYDGVTKTWYPENQNFIAATSYILTLLDDPDAAAARATLGLGSMAVQDSTGVSITGGAISGIADLAVADGGTGASDATTARANLGLGSIATQAASNVLITGGDIAGIVDLAVSDGGTGASTASVARTNLGVEIGADVQAHSATLDAVTGLAVSGLVARTAAGSAAARTITAGAGVSVADGDGVAGNPTITATGILDSVAAADLADIAHSANTAGKAAGRMVWDTDNSKIKVATGAADSDTWVDADGTSPVTPA